MKNVNLGRKVEMDFVAKIGGTIASHIDDLNGIDIIGADGYTYQLKAMLHADAGESPKHGYSVANNTAQRKNKADYFILYLPCVLSYSPRYKLSHEYYLIYKIKVTTAKEYKIFDYAKKYKNIYMPKIKRLILDELEKSGKAEIIGYGSTIDLI